MTQDIDISVVIPVYNASALIKRCIESLLSLEGQFTKEFIFVDDGSTDNSVDIINSYNSEEIRVISQENGGPAKARNRGLKEAKGKYLAFIDADDYWAPSFLNKTYTYLKEHKDIVAVSVGQRHIRSNHDTIVPSCIEQYDSPIALDDFYSFWNQYHHVCTGSVLMKIEIAKLIGGQREDLRAAEDWEFWLLIATYGKWAFIPEVLFVSDGDDVTKKRGWVEKMKPRWITTPSMDIWEERLLKRKEQLPDGYRKARGYVACRMIHGHVLGQRLELAKEEVKKYKNDFPQNDGLARLFIICSKSKLLWKFMSKALLWREYHRFK